MRMKPVITFIVALALAGCSATPADPDDYDRVEPVETRTGSNLPVDPDREDPNRVTVLDEEDIEQSGATDVGDLIRRRVIR